VGTNDLTLSGADKDSSRPGCWTSRAADWATADPVEFGCVLVDNLPADRARKIASTILDKLGDDSMMR
jgi:hypothetical protein